MADGFRSDRGSIVEKVFGDDEDTAATKTEYTWSQTADTVTLEMPVRSLTK